VPRQKPEWHAEALRLAEEDPTLSINDIAAMLGRSHNGTWRALNPGRNYSASQRVTDKRLRRTRYRGRCKKCGFPTGIGTAARSNLCRDCENKRRQARHERTLRKVERWYKAGLSYAEMSKRAGWNNRSTPTYYVRILTDQGRIEPRGARRKATAKD
jgi:hypothetical protein